MLQREASPLASGNRRGARAKGIAYGVMWITALAVLQGVLTVPADSRISGWPSLAAPPLELAALLGLLAVTRGWLRRSIAALAALLLSFLLALKGIDAAALASTGRYFNVLVHLDLLDAAWTFLSGTLGWLSAAGLLLSGAAALLLGAALIVAALRILVSGRHATRRLAGAAAALGLVAGLQILFAGPTPQSQATGYLARHVEALQKTLAEFRQFDAELADDPYAETPGEALFGTLRGKDVLIVFIESYGRTALTDARYGALLGPRLGAVESEVAVAGFAARSGWLTAPTVGGQSWLAHGALLSGLWTNSQQLYDRMIRSDRATLNALFRRAGWRSVAVMPAISEPWPDADYFGYDAVYDAHTMGYAGEPYNWVTMPDQYTLSAFRERELGPDRPPVMAEIALISSHAPWTPVPRLVAWDAVGDGRIFDAEAVAGDPPEVVWADPERVRRQYAETLDYSLETLGQFIARFGDDDLVVIALGDHQPAPLITGTDDSRDVPVHVIARDAAVLEAFAAWGWTAGMTPAADVEVLPMNAFRNRFTAAFSGN